MSTQNETVEGFPEQAQYLVANPEALHATVAADYAARWAEDKWLNKVIK
ncbi:MAG: hypothetical protein IT466_02430 [Moraxellaceae bacterium]|nr:hypothetical protein [Moraxellaceae bacterium]